MIFVGVDWAEAHHDVHVEDQDGRRLGGGRLAEGVAGIARFHELVGGHAGEAAEVVIGIETDRGLFVAALVAAGYQVFAVNPMSTSRYRERHSTSGAKSDPGDAKVLADMVRTDRHNHRPVATDTEVAQAVKVLARAHQTMTWSRGRLTNGLRSSLREFYPAALAAFDDLASSDALEVLKVAPTPTLGAGLSRAKIAAALRRGGRQRRLEERAVEIQTALRSPQLQAAPATATAMGATVTASVAVIATMNAQIAQLAGELTAGFESHPDAEVIRSLPGLGTILGARVLGEFGEPLCDDQVSQKLCRHVTDHPGVGHQKSGPSPIRPQRPSRGCHLPVGLRGPLVAGRPSPLRRPPRRRQHPPRRPTGPRQPTRRHPPRLPRTPHPLRRTPRLEPPNRPKNQPSRLTFTTVGCLSGCRPAA